LDSLALSAECVIDAEGYQNAVGLSRLSLRPGVVGDLLPVGGWLRLVPVV